MQKPEAKLLHGIYRDIGIVGELRMYPAAALYWLTTVPYKKGLAWRNKDGSLKATEIQRSDWLDSQAATGCAVRKWLSFLKSQGYLNVEPNAGITDEFLVSVTGSGVVYARESESWIGRLNLFYKKHKDGVVWLLVTALASAITAIGTTIVIEQLKQRTTPQASQAIQPSPDAKPSSTDPNVNSSPKPGDSPHR